MMMGDGIEGTEALLYTHTHIVRALSCAFSCLTFILRRLFVFFELRLEVHPSKNILCTI